MIQNLIGPPVFGKNFVGRKREYSIAASSIESGNSILLASPRRVGKSSFAHYIVDEFEKKGWPGLYIDLQGIRSEKELAELFIENFSSIPHDNTVKLGVERFLDKGIKKIGKINFKDVGVEVRQNSSALFSTVEKYLAVKNRCVVVLDEVAVFLEELTRQGGIEKTELILNWLRKTRVDNATKISWIYCSSISIQNFCSKHNLSHTINDLQSMPLGELDEEDASFLLRELDECTKYFTQDDISFILDKIGFKLPFFIQLFYSKFHAMYGTLKGMSIEESTRLVLNSLEKDQALDSWSERLQGYGDDRQIAQSLLDYICQPGAKTDRNTLISVISSRCGCDSDAGYRFSRVKRMLDTDGYIVQKDDGDIVFRSPVIRDFWFKKFVQ